MKTAVNPPESVPEWDLGSLSYGLAHEALRSENYLQRLKDIAMGPRYLILDNGADELGVGLDGDEFYSLIQEVKPQEMILPDVIGDPFETLKRGRAFLDRDLEGTTVMAVAQGLNFDEWINCYLSWTSDSRVDVIGVPYDIEFDVRPEQMGDLDQFTRTELRTLRRYNLVSYLSSHDLARKPVHLLGMNGLEEFRLHVVSGFPFIRSNDTTAPFGSALAGRTWEDGDSGPRDYPSLRFDASREEMMKVGPSVFYNLLAYFSACNDLDALVNLTKVAGQVVG